MAAAPVHGEGRPGPLSGARLAAFARRPIVRLGAALVCLIAHLVAFAASAARYDLPFNAAPEARPVLHDPAHDVSAANWSRLVVSRWDAGHYIELGLRGYEACPPRPAGGGPFVGGPTCTLAFYPTYSAVGRIASLGGVVPIDYALLAVSLIASLVFLFLWTGPAITERLGLAETWLALLLFNAFTTGFALVTVQTEPLTLVLTLGAFVALTQRRWWLVALLAGAASAMRITGVAVGAGAAAAVAVDAWANRPATRAGWARRAALAVACGWGALALALYYVFRFGDALAYVHAHGASFKHEPSLLALLWPKPQWLVFAMENPLHEGVWLVGGCLWLSLGHREALRRFAAPEQAFWYVLTLGTLAIAGLGLAPLGFVGMNRYWLLVLPLFFSMAAMLRARPVALALWLVVCGWHYWNVDLCYYTGGPGNHALDVCHAPHWIGRL
ncbi:MAG TPA: hypothetical protein VHJ20_22275 [Polyangia bacterium]|nr:hypothetical protein [Polyangia bacterium]